MFISSEQLKREEWTNVTRSGTGLNNSRTLRGEGVRFRPIFRVRPLIVHVYTVIPQYKETPFLLQRFQGSDNYTHFLCIEIIYGRQV